MMPCNPVSELNDLCSRNSLKVKWEYEVGNEIRQTICRLNVSRLASETSEMFEGVGPSKKEAKRVASQCALDSLLQCYTKPVVKALSLADVLLSALTPEKLRRDPVVRCYLYMASQLTDGWIPLGLLLATKVMKNWVDRHEELKKADWGNAKHLVASQLKSLSLDQLRADHDGLMLQPQTPVSFPDDIEQQVIGPRPEKTAWQAVIIPADLSNDVLSVLLDSRKGLVESVIDCLEVDIQHLSVIPTVRSKPDFVPSVENPSLPVDIECEDVFQKDLCLSAVQQKEIKSPTVWCNNRPGAAENSRASWFCGRSVLGDVLLTTARPSGNGSGKTAKPSVHETTHVADKAFEMTWRDYPLAYLRHGVQAIGCERIYATDLNVAIIGRLPSLFHAVSAWQGHLPYHLLCLNLRCTGRNLQETVRETDDGDVIHEMRVAGCDIVAAESGETVEAAKQRAALALIQILKKEDDALWRKEREEVERLPVEDEEILVLSPGHNHKPVLQTGTRAKIQYRLFCWSQSINGWVFVEKSDGYLMDVQDGSVLDRAVTGLRVDGACRVNFRGTLNRITGEGPMERLCLFAKVLSVVGCSNQVKLFCPPLSQQRFEAVAQQLLKHGCRHILDLGCGEGKFLEFLVAGYANRFASLHGIDISTSALKRAAAHFPQLEILHTLDVTLSFGNILSGQLQDWRHGVDAVVMIEVIEHLDPEPLDLVGRTVLGIIRPRLFIATTPNWEYNSVLYHMGGMPMTSVVGRDGTPLRCSDHRFEWTRQEFASWAMKQAAAYHYTVTFEGIGQMTLEDEARRELKLEDKDLGRSTQMAVFVRKGVSFAASAEKMKGAACMDLHTVWRRPLATDGDSPRSQ